MSSPITVRYVDSDPGGASSDSFLSRLVAAATARPVQVVQGSKQRVDLQLTSVQLPLARKAAQEVTRAAGRWLPRSPAGRDSRWQTENPQPRGDARAHIWFTGENLRPPVGPWEGYLSYDVDPLNGRNAYLPLWWHSVGLLGTAGSIFTSAMPSWQEMMQSRDPGTTPPKFACAFINNPEPMRLHAIRALAEVGPVDVFGSAVGRPVLDKSATARDYRFVLCFENDVYPGYVTEKPFEAWATGAIPLWRGSDPASYLNPAAILNAVNFPDLAAFAEVVSCVDADRAAWAAMASQPILTREPDLEPAKALIRHVLEEAS
jgi:hypothetical protein